MKKILFILSCFGFMLLSCAKDKPLGEPLKINPDYVLPQGNAPKPANDKIQQLFDQYGSYFLYNFTQVDFEWVQSTGAGNPTVDSAELGNPIYVEDMLHFLDDIWLKFLPDEFKKGGGIPYRVFLTDVIKRRRPGTGYPPGMEYLFSEYKVISKAIAFTGMNDALVTMTSAEKVAKKNLLQGVIWNYYVQNGIVTVPNSFYEASNYITAPLLPVTAANLPNQEAYRARGFLPSSYNAVSGAAFEWYNGTYAWSVAKSNDTNSYLLHLIQRTDAEMAPYLLYPKIKEKFDILVNHFHDEYGIDVRAIANATY